MGQKLAASLNRLIKEQITENMSEADVIGEMATAADIDPVAVTRILQGEIPSPPPEHLRGFADVLGDDSFIEGEGHQVAIKEVIPKEQYERLQRIKADLERALDL